MLGGIYGLFLVVSLSENAMKAVYDFSNPELYHLDIPNACLKTPPPYTVGIGWQNPQEAFASQLRLAKLHSLKCHSLAARGCTHRQDAMVSGSNVVMMLHFGASHEMMRSFD